MIVKDYHEQYSQYYDLFHEGRDVDNEVREALELLFPEEGPTGLASRLLDFGCGTGSHAVEFAERGCDVVGYDISEAMLQQARRKAADMASPPQFVDGGLTHLLEEFGSDHFHAGVCLGNVLNCLRSVKEISRHLRVLRALTAPGGRFLFSVVNGVADLADSPKSNVRHFFEGPDGRREVIRVMNPELDRLSQTCRLHYRVVVLDRDTGACEEFESVHDLLILTPVQYRHLLDLNHFKILREYPTGRPDDSLQADDRFISYLVE